MNKKKIRYYVYIIGCAFLFTATILFTSTFIAAYQTPEKAIVVPINMFGEADLELILIMISFSFAMFLLMDLALRALPRMNQEISDKKIEPDLMSLKGASSWSKTGRELL